MEFRWIAIIALWTLLSGPALHSPDAAVGVSGQRREIPDRGDYEEASQTEEVDCVGER